MINLIKKWWFPVIWLSINIFLYVTILFTNDTIVLWHISLSYKGINHFVEVFKIPLYFFAAGIPIYGIILTIKRIDQSERQLNEFRNQNQQTKKSIIEQAFFKLLESHTSFVESLVFPSITGQGRNIFNQFHANFTGRFHKHDWESSTDYIADFKTVYLEYLHTSGGETIYVYFNNLNNILKHLDENKLIVDIDSLINIFRSQLSKYELLFIMYHSISNIIPGFLKLVREFDVLKYINIKEPVKTGKFDSFVIYKNN